MEQLPQLYHYVKVSGLTDTELLDEVLSTLEEDKDDKVLTYRQLNFEPMDLHHIQHLPLLRNICYKPRSATDGVQQAKVAVQKSDDSLDGEKAQSGLFSPLDKQFAAELVACGLINDWQSRQLLERRTKFTLGDYRILDAIGEGGYGHVFLGIDNSIWQPAKKNDTLFSRQSASRQYVAIKVLPLSKTTEELTRRFQHEIEIQKNLAHPGLVRYIDSGHDGNVHYMVHEFVNGGDLRTLFYKEKVLPVEIAAPVISQTARTLAYLHENGVVHRDVKPANVLLGDDGTAKLTDMGLSVPYDKFSLDKAMRRAEEMYFSDKQIEVATQMTGKIAGTVDFMAPDQIRTPMEPSPAWDIYSLGCALYQLLTGSVPFPNGEMKQKLYDRLYNEPKESRVLNPFIPFDIAGLLKKMLAKNPLDRPAAQDVADTLDAWVPPNGLLYGLAF